MIFMLIVLMIVAFTTFTGNNRSQILTPGNSEFKNYVEKGQVANVSIVAGDMEYTITGELKDGRAFYVTDFPNMDIGDFLAENNVEIKSYAQEPEPAWWMDMLSILLPMLLIAGLIIFLMQQSQGGGGKVMQFGKSRAKLHTDDRKKVSFADVAGVDEVKEELEEVVDFLKDPRRYTAIGARIPKGVLLYGPPGTGKTLLARAVAGEAGVPFFSISGSDFVEMFVGVGASRVRDLFEQGKKHAPCIIFIDEIDAVGRQRGAGLGGGHDEREQTLNQLLVEMDGFTGNEGVIVIAATNRPDILDPALLRPGRFDREITVDAPDVLGREQILQVHAKGKPLDSDVDLKVVARRTPGFTGADLANVVNEAALMTARFHKTKIGMHEFEQAAERVIAGPEKKSRVINEREKKLVSYHEAGHAVVSYFLDNSDPLHKISIIPRGRAGGYTLLLPKEDKKYLTKSMILDDLVMLLGGRVSEKLILKDVSTGAQNDLQRATASVRQLITRYGMSDELGPLTFGREQEAVFLGRDFSHERNYSEAIAYAIDKEARQIMDDAFRRAEAILAKHLDKLHLVAHVLMEKETIEAEEFYQLMQQPAVAATDEGLKEEPLPESAKDQINLVSQNLPSSDDAAKDEEVKPDKNSDEPPVTIKFE